MRLVYPAGRPRARGIPAIFGAGPARSFSAFLLRDGIGFERKLHDVALDRTDELFVDVVVVILVTFLAVLLGQLDAITLNLVDGADLDAILADDLLGARSLGARQGS